MSDKIVILTDENFEEKVLNAHLPVLVDFWADWCGPCKMVAPTIEQLAEDYEGQVIVGKLETDNNRKTVKQYLIRSIPTIIVFVDGEVVARESGARPKKFYKDMIDTQLALLKS